MALGHCCSPPQWGHDEGKNFQTLQRSSLLCLGGGSTWAFSKHNLHRLLLEMCCFSRLVQAISNSATLHRRSSHTKLLRHVPQAEGRNGWYPFSFGSPPRGLWSSHWAFWTLHRLLCSRDETLDRSLAQRHNDFNYRFSNWKNVIESQFIDMFNFTVLLQLSALKSFRRFKSKSNSGQVILARWSGVLQIDHIRFKNGIFPSIWPSKDFVGPLVSSPAS